MDSGLTPRLRRYIEKTFSPDAARRVAERLEEWRISYEDEAPSERLKAAALLCSEGGEERLADCLELGEADWRDLLMGTGLEHENWPEVMDREFGT